MTEILTEPIIAYRSWFVSRSCRQIKSTGNGTMAWPRLTAPAAACRSGCDVYSMYFRQMEWLLGPRAAGEDEQEHHEAPSFACNCGYYAMKRVEEIPEGSVYGRIAIWGRVVEMEHGYRSQYAYPQVFYIEPAAKLERVALLRKLAAEYGCEVVPMPEVLVQEIAKRAKAKLSSFLVATGSGYNIGYQITAQTPQPTLNDEIHEKGLSRTTQSHPFRMFIASTQKERRKGKHHG